MSLTSLKVNHGSQLIFFMAKRSQATTRSSLFGDLCRTSRGVSHFRPTKEALQGLISVPGLGPLSVVGEVWGRSFGDFSLERIIPILVKSLDEVNGLAMKSPMSPISRWAESAKPLMNRIGVWVPASLTRLAKSMPEIA